MKVHTTPSVLQTGFTFIGNVTGLDGTLNDYFYFMFFKKENNFWFFFYHHAASKNQELLNSEPFQMLDFAVHMFHQHKDDVTVQAHACFAIERLCAGQIDYVMNLVRNHHFLRSLVPVLQANMEHASFVRHASTVIRRCSWLQALLPDLVIVGAPEVILRVMERYPEDADLLEDAATCLYNIALHGESQLLMDLNAHDTLVGAMKRHRFAVGLAAEGCAALGALSAAPTSATVLLQAPYSIHVLLIQAVQDHTNSSRVVEYGLYGLWSATARNHSVRGSLLSNGVNIFNVITRAMRSHATVSAIQANGSAVLSEWISYGVDQAIGSSPITQPPLRLRLLRPAVPPLPHDDARMDGVVSASAAATAPLPFPFPIGAATAAAEQGLAAESSPSSHSSDTRSWEQPLLPRSTTPQAVALLQQQQLQQPPPIMPIQFCRTLTSDPYNIHHLILSTMRVFPLEEDLNENCCGILMALAEDAVSARVLIDANAHKIVWEAMKQQPDNNRLVANAISFFTALVQHVDVAHILVFEPYDVPAYVIRAMQLFSRDINIQPAACLFFRNLSRTPYFHAINWRTDPSKLTLCRDIINVLKTMGKDSWTIAQALQSLVEVTEADKSGYLLDTVISAPYRIHRTIVSIMRVLRIDVFFYFFYLRNYYYAGTSHRWLASSVVPAHTLVHAPATTQPRARADVPSCECPHARPQQPALPPPRRMP